MKISEMSVDQATEAMVRLAGPFSEICDDEEAVALVDEYKQRYSKPFFYALGKIIPGLVAHLLKKHKGALFEIISVLTDKKPDEIGKMNFKEMIQTLSESYDDTLTVFFPFSGKATLNAGRKLPR